jgi:NAD(P)-dependent dehydrogenase (short-subunit alcohol dehydrogenase family)
MLVTGATGAIGRVAVSALAAAGAQVVASDVAPLGSAEVRTLQRDGAGAVDYVRCEITDEAQVADAVAGAVRRHGRLDGAANVAGIVGPSVTTTDYDAEAFRAVLDVNLVGTWLCLKHEIAAMLEGGGGAIVNIASIAGHAGEMRRSPYVASKAGVIGLTRTAAIEYAARGVRVNAVSPGPIDTAQFHANVGGPGSERYRRVLEALPAGRMGQAQDVAAAVVWLLSDASAFVVGHELVVDGGITAEAIAVPRLVPPAVAGGAG